MPKTTTTPTPERLAQALEALDDPRLDLIIERARSGFYDDFKTPLAYPQIELLKDLRPFGHAEIIRRIIDGEFDATPEESAAWAKSPEGQKAFKSLMGTDWD